MTKPARALSWYRLELDRAGEVISCRLVDAAGTDGAGVHYFRAVSEAAARKAAFNAYNCARNAVNREKLKAQGRCKCGRALDTDGKTCSWCRERDVVHKERYAARQRGEKIPKADWAAAHTERRTFDQNEIVRDTLREVLRRFHALPKADFVRYLESEIRKLAGRSVA